MQGLKPVSRRTVRSRRLTCPIFWSSLSKTLSFREIFFLLFCFAKKKEKKFVFTVRLLTTSASGPSAGIRWATTLLGRRDFFLVFIFYIYVYRFCTYFSDIQKISFFISLFSKHCAIFLMTLVKKEETKLCNISEWKIIVCLKSLIIKFVE